jgi:hypothetical protein
MPLIIVPRNVLQKPQGTVRFFLLVSLIIMCKMKLMQPSTKVIQKAKTALCTGAVHPPYIPYLTPSDFHFFQHWRNFLVAYTSAAMKDGVKQCLNGLAAEVYDWRHTKTRHKCLNVGGDSVENNFGSVIMTHSMFLVMFGLFFFIA